MKIYKKLKTKKVKTFYSKFRKGSIQFHLKSYLQKSLNTTPLFYELLANGAFKGAYYKDVHFSQENLIYAYKNKISFYKMDSCINLLNNAFKFVSGARKNKNQEFVFVGNPPKVDLETKNLFRQIKIRFFGQNIWQPGFFSKKPKSCSQILIIYDIKTNNYAFKEAVSIKVPVVAFVTPFCDIGGVDYPVVLNLENAGIAYIIFCKILIKK